ncbi:Validoxylamine A glucosyltransferase [Pseudoalteromonas holothuriae]|uniref:Validoxylamine A glucosyltransferase n=1 Tax=Pseudoalteromonas holothuriae TaxID=2963714 RepID=A0A9W4R511_9GAMM|nr:MULTISPECIES: glycosyltransferase [unclassified Pseudoalteromonas]CAH9067179.1 Validoxylamine A glucosyltransferase [Pseudoalteromonas sp. CIP111854]CAH9068232.1 Validoxylamine A glucosyltransferase [Pseudoalteromonas sp. CIP111951]
MRLQSISIVIPTYNSMLLLKETLDSLLLQTLNRERFEVIVVDDGSSDGTKQIVDQFRKLLDISYYYIEDKGFRVSSGRNLGLHFAKYPITLFLDSGMIANKEMLFSHLNEHLFNNKKVAIGMSYGVEEFSLVNAQALNNILLSNGLNESFNKLKDIPKLYDCRYSTVQSIGFDLSVSSAPWVICWGGNVSARTSFLRQVGGFDEWFNSWGGEDVDLGIRLFKNHGQFVVLKEQCAIHKPHPKFEEKNKITSRKNIDYIVRKYTDPMVSLLTCHDWKSIIELSVEREILVSC